MFAGWKSTFFLLFFIPWFFGVEFGYGEVEPSCPPLDASDRGTCRCRLRNQTVFCGGRLPVGSLAEFECEEFYRIEGANVTKCLPDGKWSSSPPKCVPECGKGNPAVSLIVNGVVASPGAFPWHVAIYNYIGDEYEFWCGGSLISENIVITAAHCTWNVSPENLFFAFGKFARNYDFNERGVQKIRGKRIEMLKSYQDVAGNYNGDLSVVFLERAVRFGHLTRPICLDWDQKFMDTHLREGSFGVVLGWGLTENDTFSDVLRIIELPVASDEKCIAEQQRDFLKFITYTSFCAGFKNGTGVCNGDSGGGLAFLEKDSGLWYLQGLVSVSPRRLGTSFCDPYFYTVFTKVSMFTKWLKRMKEIEEEMVEGKTSSQVFNKKSLKSVYGYIKKYFDKHPKELKGKPIYFPHSQKILELLGYSNTVNEIN